MSERKERIGIIGSGIAGSLTARELARTGDYDVTILEERPKFFSGASENAAHTHMGGLYSGNVQTAIECLHSAIEMKKELPHALKNEESSFLIADESSVSLEQYAEFYESLREHYAGLPEEDQIFGSPEEFYKAYGAEEFPFIKNIEGGIKTREVGLNMEALRSQLGEELGRRGVKLYLETEVIEVEQQDSGFGLTVERDGDQQLLPFDRVVNAGNHKARLLDHQLGDKTPYSLFLKTWNVVKNSGQPMPPFFVVRGDFMVHFPKDKESQTSVLNATDSGSYIDHIVYDVDNPSLPDEWNDILSSKKVPNEQERQKAILDYAGDNFLKDASQIEPVEMIPGVATSFSSSRQNRTQRGANHVVEGWQTIVPTKATHGLELSREAAQNISDSNKQASS